LRVQLSGETEVAALLQRLVTEAIPNERGRDAWQALLRAHATLLRQLATDLVEEIGLTLGDFDVLAHLGQAGGELRMSELAAQAYSSRSGMTRRIDRLVDEGLVSRANADADGRGVVVALTDAGLARLAEAAPVHLRRVSELFVAKLSDEELSALATALHKVALDCTFG
jgi:DNA-binding MarR family transcriptional regulator